MSFMDNVKDYFLSSTAAPAHIRDAVQDRHGAVVFGGGRIEHPNFDFDRIAREGYQQNSVVQSCVDLISKSISAVEIKVEGEGSETGRAVLENIIRKPNADQDWSSFIDILTASHALYGNSFIERDSDKMLKGISLFPIQNAGNMKVESNSTGGVAGYVYKPNNSRKIKFPIDKVAGIQPILHIKMFSALNGFYGDSKVQGAAWAVDGHNANSSSLNGLQSNGGVPPGMISFKSKDGDHSTLTNDQLMKLKDDLDSRFSDSRQSGRPMILEGDVTWTGFAPDPKSSQLLETRSALAREIALTLGVPPLLLGLPGDNTFANYKEANVAFYRQTVMPLLKQILGSINVWLENGNWVDVDLTDLKFVADEDSVPVLLAAKREAWERIDKVSFLTINEKRKLAGFEELEGEAPNSILVQSSLISLEELDNLPHSEPDGDDVPEDENA